MPKADGLVKRDFGQCALSSDDAAGADLALQGAD